VTTYGNARRTERQNAFHAKANRASRNWIKDHTKKHKKSLSNDVQLKVQVAILTRAKTAL
jgi:hypothetical protein